MDPNNPVVKLCVEGMQAEGAGRHDDARALFAQAWDARTDDWEACIAAHYLARHQPTPEDTLRWNQAALHRADAVTDDRVNGFYPSLYLNLAHSHEQLGNHAEARRYYDLAAAESSELPEDRYAGIVREGIRKGQARTTQESEAS
jgi:tetratricopeptide (TPR) repeat protein